MTEAGAAVALPAIGDTIRSKYQLVRPLGQGGMGLVFEAQHLRLQQRVALKLLRPSLVQDAEYVMRFEREARAAARLRSVNVARVFDVDTTESGVPFLVMELLEGHDLASHVRARGRLPVAEAVDIVIQVCCGLAEAHEAGIVHRDVKPGNLFLCGSGPGMPTVKVLDFGISKVSDDVHTTASAVTVGTPQYMSPEQILAPRTVDAQTDLWALGVILYRLLTGRFPFEGDGGAALAVVIATTDPRPFTDEDRVPSALAAVILRALRRERSERWPNVEALARALEPFGSLAFVAPGSVGAPSRPSARLVAPESTQRLPLEGPPRPVPAEAVPAHSPLTPTAGATGTAAGIAVVQERPTPSGDRRALVALVGVLAALVVVLLVGGGVLLRRGAIAPTSGGLSAGASTGAPPSAAALPSAPLPSAPPLPSQTAIAVAVVSDPPPPPPAPTVPRPTEARAPAPRTASSTSPTAATAAPSSRPPEDPHRL